jgi:hypothetical protein
MKKESGKKIMNNAVKKIKIYNNHKHEWKINKIIQREEKKYKRRDKLGRKRKGKSKSGKERWKMVKRKAIPLQAWTGSEGSRRLRLPDFWKIMIRRNKNGKDRRRDRQYIMVERPKTHHILLLTVAPRRMGQRWRQVRDVSLKRESRLNSGTRFVQTNHLALTECVSNSTICDSLS